MTKPATVARRASGSAAMTDPIADLLTRIRNASMARHSTVTMPFSKMKGAIADILKDEGFIRDCNIVRSGTHRALRVYLIYGEKGKAAISGLQRVSKPSLRIYSGHAEIPRVYGGLGTTIVSTSKGVMTGKEAWKQKIGGEVLCTVW
ncbi:MAG: ribosomal protein [Dehalococcoidia bacterium]|nr:ribosomal protein [Dehalococcoidia bacterium]